ncbi:MAG: hypothetical protein PHI28_19400, partial [Mangrovibacterium sp.]|nr:hypothetical protein [Mangrovibacterium sp.]
VHPDRLITACPLCKKTFTKGTEIQARDLAELVWEGVCRSAAVARRAGQAAIPPGPRPEKPAEVPVPSLP